MGIIKLKIITNLTYKPGESNHQSGCLPVPCIQALIIYVYNKPDSDTRKRFSPVRATDHK